MQMVKLLIPLVQMVQMVPTNGTIGRTPNKRSDSVASFKHEVVSVGYRDRDFSGDI